MALLHLLHSTSHSPNHIISTPCQTLAIALTMYEKFVISIHRRHPGVVPYALINSRYFEVTNNLGLLNAFVLEQALYIPRCGGTYNTVSTLFDSSVTI